jgi:AcrR family transcriptional regulator
MSGIEKRRYRMTARAEAAAATRERLLGAAWKHFATRPYDDVRLREIADAAHCTVQTLHASFGSKDDLLSAAFVRWGLRETARRDAAPVGEVSEAIRILFDHYETDGPAVLRMLAQEERVPAIRRLTDAGRLYHRTWAARTFQPLLGDLRGRAQERRLAAIVVATDLLVWKLLRLDMHLGRREAERTVADMLQRLTTAPTHAVASRTPIR